jgi:hypothetical protein
VEKRLVDGWKSETIGRKELGKETKSIKPH